MLETFKRFRLKLIKNLVLRDLSKRSNENNLGYYFILQFLTKTLQVVLRSPLFSPTLSHVNLYN